MKLMKDKNDTPKSFEAALNERAHLIGNLFDEAEPVEE